jgi:hypothetical protein
MDVNLQQPRMKRTPSRQLKDSIPNKYVNEEGKSKFTSFKV